MKKNDFLGYLIFCIMSFLNWAIAGWAIGRYLEWTRGWHYWVGVLIWAGVNVVVTIIGMIIITRRS